MLESKEAVASVFPDGAHARALTVLLWPVGMVEMWENLRSEDSEEVLEVYLYSRTDLSAEQVARRGFVGFHAMCQARSLCPVIVVSVSRSLI